MHIFRPVEADGSQMFVVRCDFKNGAHREYGYTDLGVATDTFKTLDMARSKSTSCSIFDEGGRQASVDCRDLMVVELVDIQKETLTAIKMVSEVNAIQRAAGFVAPAPQPGPPQVPADRDQEPEYRPAIGRSSFAS
jgi:hypothetical protein